MKSRIEDISKNKRLIKILAYFRENCEDLMINNSLIVLIKECIINKQKLKDLKLKIISSNSFPTAAGCASSASSMSCLIKILEKIYNYKEKFNGDLTTLARYCMVKTGNYQVQLVGVCMVE